MKAARAASLSAPIIYAPGTSFDLSVTFPVDDYDLTGKWMTFELRKSKTGSIVFRLDETSAALTISSQTGSIAIEPDTANGISGGPTLGDIAKGDQTLFFSVDFGDDTDTGLAEYRLQGDITVITEQGSFTDTSAVTSVTPTFESVSVTATVIAKGDTGATGATGATGPTGPEGPNNITGSTTTDITGVLVGDGSNVSEGPSFGTGPNNAVQLDGTGALPAVSGANLTDVGGGGTSVSVSDTAPLSPSAGDLWFDSSKAKMYIYYSDANTDQWVSVTSGLPTPDSKTGWIDYNDSTGSFSITADTWTNVPNNGAGSFTNKAFKPPSVTEVLDTTTGHLDFSDLPLGSEITLRNDITVVPNSNNALLQMRYVLGTGANEYALNFLNDRLDSGSGVSYQKVNTFPIYMGDTNTKNNPGKLQIKLSVAGTVTNSGVYASIQLY